MFKSFNARFLLVMSLLPSGILSLMAGFDAGFLAGLITFVLFSISIGVTMSLVMVLTNWISRGEM